MSMKSTAATMVISYDDANGAPQDITEFVQSMSDWERETHQERSDPFGVELEQFTSTGKGRIAPIELGGIFDASPNGPDDLFGNRDFPENPDSEARTLTVQWLTGRTSQVETRLSMYKTMPNRENGLTRWMVRLQPASDLTETYPT